jgi:hypothetical protein
VQLLDEAKLRAKNMADMFNYTILEMPKGDLLNSK